MLSLNNIIQLLNAEKAKRKKPNWNQNVPTQEDYIENRPFYKEKSELVFTDEDYKDPIFESDGMFLYKLADTLPQLEGQDNIYMTYGKTKDSVKTQKMHIVTKGDDYVEDDISQLNSLIFYENTAPDFSGDVGKEIETLVTEPTFSGNGNTAFALILYKESSYLIGEKLDVGVYVVLNDEYQYKLYGLSSEKVHKIPSEYLTETITKSEIQDMIDNSVTSVLGGAS